MEKIKVLFTETSNGDTTYFVDFENGNDSNDGKSEALAWKSLDKVNTVEFKPNDKILFKSGCTWIGKLWPKGSGSDGQPIIIGKYGEGSKPRFMPGEDETHDYVSLGISYIPDVKVNQNIMLYNQSFWEISDIELFDPKYDSINPSETDVLRRGIFLCAEDFGRVQHIYIDNVDINGYRGKNDNFGKNSGGIIWNIYTHPELEENRVPTWFHNIRITNCTIENVGRSGINSISPWCTRDPLADNGKWGEEYFIYYGIGEYTPHTDIYIGHNIFRNIDGDGMIIDEWKNAIVEHNLVDTFVVNCVFAAGIFPWNSEDVYIQFNECCNGMKGDDAQGIEIDALNERNYVQYNYVHDNAGGFMQWCTLKGYATYDSHYRYNISVDDRQNYATITLFSHAINCSAYNNTVYLTDNVQDKFLDIRKFEESSIEIYNNIFYKAGKPYDITQNNMFSEENLKWNNNIFHNFDFKDTPAEVIGNNIINQDPLFVAVGNKEKEKLDGYKLKENSPAINAGKIAINNGGRDFFGNTVPQDKAPDIGACQSK